MRKLSLLTTAAAAISLGLSVGCRHTHSHGDMKALGTLDHAVAVMHPTAGNSVSGVVRFTQVGGKVKVVADITGLNPNQNHAIHVHHWGDTTGTDGKKTGGHYNPAGHDHALPGSEKRHAGDLGNLAADANGKAHYEIEVSNISVSTGMHPIVGRGVIIHAKVDDGGQPTGNAGARIAQGVIGFTDAPE
jgi:Cu-Zn family superoxide dismutase